MSMDTRTDPFRDAQAERWFARLRGGECGVAELAAYREWCADPLNAEAMARVESLWDELGGLSGGARQQRWSAEALRRPRWRRPAALAAAALLAGIAFTVLVSRGVPEPATGAIAPLVYDSRAGDIRSERLPDGSRVTLAGDAEVVIRYQDDARLFEVLRGELMIESARDAARPLRLNVAQVEVRVVGTRFMVLAPSAPGEPTSVTLLSGGVEVAVAGRDEVQRLSPGQRLRVDADGGTRLDTVDPEVASAWATGRLILRDVDLAEALEMVNRHSRLKLESGGAELAGRRVSGVLQIGDARAMAQALAWMFGLDVRHRGDRILLVPGEQQG